MIHLLHLKKCAPFSTCKTEINDASIEEANRIYIAMPMYNLTENVIIIQIELEVYDNLKESNLQMLRIIWLLMITIISIFNHLNIKQPLLEREKMLLMETALQKHKNSWSIYNI